MNTLYLIQTGIITSNKNRLYKKILKKKVVLL